MQPLLSVKQVSEKLNVSDKLIYKQISNGTIRIPYVKIGECIRFKECDIERYVDNKMIKPKSKRIA